MSVLKIIIKLRWVIGMVVKKPSSLLLYLGVGSFDKVGMLDARLMPFPFPFPFLFVTFFGLKQS